MDVVLPVGYYCENFKTLLGFVAAHYSDILSEQEQALLDRFNDASPSGTTALCASDLTARPSLPP